MSNAPSPDTGWHVANARRYPRIRRAAKALISSSSRVFLVKERHADGRSFWTLPGGGVRTNETLVGGLRRELLEELCCEPVVRDVVSSFWYVHESTHDVVSLNTVFACHLPSTADPDRSEGIVDSRWVDPTNPPSGTLLQIRQLIDRLEV
jgi:ADP-ribose pyrophosphatase YjhB (NUDIX family)